MLNQKKHTGIKTATTMIAALLSFNALADSHAISDGMKPGDSDSKWVLGGSVGTFNNPLAGEDTEYFVAPNIEYRGERFFLKDGQAGVSLYQQPAYSIGLLLTANGSLLADKDDYKDNVRLAGLKERDGTLDAGVYFIHRSDAGRLKMTLMDEITNEHSGMTADVNYVFDMKMEGWSVNPIVGATWLSSATVDHFFGVGESEVNEHRKAYQGDSALNLYAGVRGRYEVTENWDVTAEATYVHLGAGIKDSSIVEDDYVLVSSVGVNYNF
ncbi:MipA/OmpV family protein [Oceanospirillum sediminis]|uniref:MipA/OmpV family protein n=1 Tax=Oceanospirillum sediminis TaxID=2760088 RepID=A0A839IRH9_9GAMM|nr:MipA/OmpV family protein [Oceanospirillum sediminis]MBB1486816.1 MipA/OmpV family protein [Oceanospirillum sediminis]